MVSDTIGRLIYVHSHGSDIMFGKFSNEKDSFHQTKTEFRTFDPREKRSVLRLHN